MSITTMREFVERHRLSELASIASSLVMAVVSYVPVYLGYDRHQLAVATFFAVLFVLRSVLFLWERRVEGTRREKREQAKMMLLSALVLLLMHSTFLIAVIYQLISKKDVPLMASAVALAITYGVYAIVKIALLVRRAIIGRDKNLYDKTLARIGWISAFYTLALFTNYLLINQHANDYVWPRYIMIAAVGLSTIVLGTKMLVTSISTLRALRQEQA